jgi:hypothetical protein
MPIPFFPARDDTMNAYNQLTYEQQCQIYALIKASNSQSKIGSAIGVSELVNY